MVDTVVMGNNHHVIHGDEKEQERVLLVQWIPTPSEQSRILNQSNLKYVERENPNEVWKTSKRTVRNSEIPSGRRKPQKANAITSKDNRNK